MTTVETAGEAFFESHDDGRISAAVLNRGAKRNAMSPDFSKALLAVLERALADRSHILLIRSAAPGIFCAGFDISYLDTDRHAEGQAAMAACFAAVDTARKVTVNFAAGGVLGGGVELFLTADIRLATPRTTFRLTPARLGVVYSARGLSRFVQVMGVTATSEMLLAARTLTADEALRVGLVTRIVADEAAALAYCRDTARLAPLAQQAMKATIRQLGAAVAPARMEAEAWRHLDDLRARADASEDQKEGRRAFLEKREARFTGR